MFRYPLRKIPLVWSDVPQDQRRISTFHKSPSDPSRGSHKQCKYADRLQTLCRLLEWSHQTYHRELQDERPPFFGRSDRDRRRDAAEPSGAWSRNLPQPGRRHFEAHLALCWNRALPPPPLFWQYKGALKKNLHQQPQTKKGVRKRQCPALCEVCLRPSAISADVTHAVGVADLAPATEHAEASLFAPFAVVVAVLAPEARLFAPFGQLNLFLRLWVSVDFGEVLFVHACSWLVQRDPGMSQIHWLILVVLSPPSLEPLTLPFYCSPVPVLKNRLNSRSEVMILSRARDALQTPADTRFQWKGQGRGLKNTHKSHFAFPRLPELVKIKGMHGTPDRTAWTSPSHGEKKRKVLLPEQAWRPQTITAELDSSLPRHWTRLERSWTTVGQP